MLTFSGCHFEIIVLKFFICHHKFPPTFCVFDGLDFEAQPVPGGQNEIKKTKLYINASPQAGINTRCWRLVHSRALYAHCYAQAQAWPSVNYFEKNSIAKLVIRSGLSANTSCVVF